IELTRPRATVDCERRATIFSDMDAHRDGYMSTAMPQVVALALLFALTLSPDPAAAAKPCYGALGATQTEQRAAAVDRSRSYYAGRDQRYAAGAQSRLRLQMRQQGCNSRDAS